MDFVQQAMERFKHRPGDDGARPQRSTGAAPSAASPVIYTSTRTVELTDDTMRAQRLITGFEGGPFVDAYKMLRTQVVQQFRQQGWTALGVTSPAVHSGKTLTAVNLSLALAMDLTHTVLLVDADLHRPRVHEAFGLTDGPGLTEYLFDDVPLRQLLVHPGIGRFVFLPGGRRIRNSAEALASPKMAALVHELKHRYPARLVVFDMPPILSRADVLGFAPHLDALLLVVEEGRTASTDVERAMGMLKGTVPILGGVLNKAGRSELTQRRAHELLMVQAG
jgi:Mrp family chromosome partitioning ATPase